MPPSITLPVKCRPHPCLAPQSPAAALELLAARGAPAAAELRAAYSRCRTPMSLSLSLCADPAEPRGPALPLSRSADSAAPRAPCRGSPSERRARAAVACRGDEGDDGGPPALMLAGVLSRYAIFRDDLVRRAFAAAEAAHRGQVLDRVPVALARICIHLLWPASC